MVIFYSFPRSGLQQRTPGLRAQSDATAAAGAASAAGERRGRQQGGRQQQRGPERPRGPARAAAAAARLPLALELLAQDARVGRGALAPHVVDAGPAVLAVQQFVVAHVWLTAQAVPDISRQTFITFRP